MSRRRSGGRSASAAGHRPIGLALAAGVLAYAAIDRRLAATLTEGIDMPQTPAAPAMAPDESPQDRSHRGARRDRWIGVGVVIAMAVATADTSLFGGDAAQGARDRVAIGEIPPPGATAGGVALDPGPPPGATAGGVALDPGPPPGATAGGVALDPGPPPVSIALPAIRVESELEDLRLAADGTLTVPRDAARAGWWSQGVAPGDPGPAVIVGHVDSYDGPGIFLLLHRLQPGDEAVVRRNDGTSVTFVVDAVHQFQKDAFPTDIVYGPTPEPTLRLITCGGSFDKRTRSYDDNVIVFAHLKAPDAA